jgi:hypothetical protein
MAEVSKMKGTIFDQYILYIFAFRYDGKVIDYAKGDYSPPSYLPPSRGKGIPGSASQPRNDEELRFRVLPSPGMTAKRLDVITSCSYYICMNIPQKRSTIYFDSSIHKALRLKAAETERSVSEIVNEAVKFSLAEDAEDLAAFEERAKEPNLAFEDVLKDLKRSGTI